MFVQDSSLRPARRNAESSPGPRDRPFLRISRGRIIEETFRVCPWQEEILDRIARHRSVSFHCGSHCNNFLEPPSDRRVESGAVPTAMFTDQHGGTIVDPAPSPSASIRTSSRWPFRPDLETHERRLRSVCTCRGQNCCWFGVDRQWTTQKASRSDFGAYRSKLRRVLHPDLRRCAVSLRVPDWGSESDAHRFTSGQHGGGVEGAWLIAGSARRVRAEWRPDRVPERAQPTRERRISSTAWPSSPCVVSSLHDGMGDLASEGARGATGRTTGRAR